MQVNTISLLFVLAYIRAFKSCQYDASKFIDFSFMLLNIVGLSVPKLLLLNNEVLFLKTS